MRNKKQKINKKDILVKILCIILSIIAGIITNDIFIGGTLLATGLLSRYLAYMGKRSNYIFGTANALIMAYIAFKNNLFGSFIGSAFIFAPLQAYGFFAWSRNLDKTKTVKIKKFTIKDSLIVTIGCALGGIIFGYILTLIPGQQLAFMDSTIACIDVCAIILMNLRFREAWGLLVINGILTIIIWTIAFAGGGENALMRLITSVGFLIINICSLIKWSTSKKVKIEKF